MLPKIKVTHLLRLAVIYIRQSSMAQVHDHQESRRLQYKLEERAKDFGWISTKVIDCDLGLSGSGSTERPGFAQLLELVCMKAVGAIFCLEASRLARNSREWSQLIELCAIFDVLIIDLDGIYDPCNLSDRTLLGLKGTMSEYEIGIFRMRAQAAIQEKAKRGEFYGRVPAGFELTPDDRCEMDPDQHVREAIASVFAKFRELGSIYQIVLWFRREGRQLPTRAVKGGAITWKLPTTATINKILTNPIYAGAYCYGRRQTEVRIVDGQPRKFSRKLPMSQWKYLLTNQHDGYISWDEYLENQQRLQQNLSHRNVAMKGSAKRGPALLVGLLRCQKCGHRFQVRYRGAHSNIPRYVCTGQDAEGRNWRCLEFYGTQLETLVASEILRVVEPVALTAALEAETLAQQNRREKEDDCLHRLATAEYEANRCFEQYNRVDPKNRLIAQNLENRWEQAQQKVEDLQQQLNQIRQACPPLSAEERERLAQLARDLPAVWNHPTADVRIKKRILQTLIEEIVVDLDNASYWVFSIHWTGGKHTQYRLKRRRRGERENQSPPDLEATMRGLAEVTPDREIARILNLLRIKTASGKTWLPERVARFRHQHNIPAFNKAEYEQKGLVNLKQAAEILGLEPMTIYRLLKANIISGRQVIRYAPWAIEKEQLHRPSVEKVVAAIKAGRAKLLTQKPSNPNQLNLE